MSLARVSSLGAYRREHSTHFRTWAPDKKRVEVIVERDGGTTSEYPLTKSTDGYFEGSLAEIEVGDLYRFRLDGQGPYPDPASRFQPLGVHGPSEVVDPSPFAWTDKSWMEGKFADLIFYEMHVGTFTAAGTYSAAREHLPYLRDLGVTAVELMPVADFAGDRNWGYDGSALFAPARCYGRPDDLRAFVDDAHGLGLAVYLDVVYNHLGPDGAYLGLFSPHYFSKRHKSLWGDALNFDGPGSEHVRRFFIENALRWVHEYHIDGLRLDATHAIIDESPRPFLTELAASVRESVGGRKRKPCLIAEDHRNLALLIKPEQEGGTGLDGVWADDFHHQVRRRMAGDSDGYFRDFDGTADSIAATVKRGWFYCGEHSSYFDGPRGTDPLGVTPSRFVFFIQNHDQIGNRAFGERLHHQIDLAAYRAVTALLLLAPETPLLFMGQEWASSSPFQYFTDHHEELGRLVTEGRRREFSRFAAFSAPANRERIPDPQSEQTFHTSRLNWNEQSIEPHASVLRLYRQLLWLRRQEPALRPDSGPQFEIAALGDNSLVMRRAAPTLASSLLVVLRLEGAGVDDLRGNPLAAIDVGNRWTSLLTTEDSGFAHDPAPPRVDPAGPVIEFVRPGAVVLKAVAAEKG